MSEPKITFNNVENSLNNFYDVFTIDSEAMEYTDQEVVIAKKLVTDFEDYATSNEFAIGKHLAKPRTVELQYNILSNTLYTAVTEARRLIKNNESQKSAKQ
jgi:hypothetical protein